MPGEMQNQQAVAERKGYFMIATALFAAMTTAGAFIRIPLPWVPITLQTMFVLLSGYLLGFFYGALSQILYLLIGLLGFPVFAQGGGPAYVLKPTFGYLMGFPLAAATVGYLIHGAQKQIDTKAALERLAKLSAARIILTAFAGLLVIFLPGVIYLYAMSHVVVKLPMSLSQAFVSGFLIFIPADTLKVVAIYAFIRMMGRYKFSASN